METSLLFRLGIVLLPDILTAAKAMELSQAVLPFAEVDPQTGRPHVLLTLAPTSMQIPHISLFHLLVQPEKIVEAAHALSDLDTGGQRPVQGLLHETRIAHAQWAFWDVVPSPQIAALHEQVLQRAAPLRDANVTPSTDPTLSAEQREAAATYGFLNAGRAYEPHLTFGYVRPETRLPRCDPQPFISGILALAELGERGTVVKILKTFHL